MDPTLIALIAVALGLAAGWLLGSSRARLAESRVETELRQQLAERDQKMLTLETGARLAGEQRAGALAEAEALRRQMNTAFEQHAQRVAALETETKKLRDDIQAARDATADAEQRAARITAQTAEREKSLLEQIAKLEAAEARLTKEFENVANRIFTEKQQQFGDQSTQTLNALLTPFREQIEGFRKKVEDVYSEEQRERHVLKHEIGLLKDLNQRITTEAANLTRALKGDNKLQGNWGEMILEKILETSGLHEGREYVSQKGLKHEEGKKHITDVIVRLPEGKDVIIDSKASLVDWERCIAADHDAERIAALDAHTASLRSHVRILAGKDYQNLEGVTSLDYVLMFVPIESAFHAAIAHDEKLVEYALERNIMLVSPSTLLIALRTIYNLWRYEYQNRHALEISRIAGTMHDKLAAFVADMNAIKTAIGRAGDAWDEAHKKLATGKGNVIGQAERIRKLGGKASKQIDKGWIDPALPDSGHEDDETDSPDAGDVKS